MTSRTWISLLACPAALVAGGCGSGPRSPTAATVTPEQRAAVTQPVADFINGYERADGPALCETLTPAARRRIAVRLVAAVPSLRGLPCAQLLIRSDVYGDPRNQPPAIDEASAFRFRNIAVQGRRATLVFPDGRRWRLVQSGSAWRIDDLPFIPPSLDR